MQGQSIDVERLKILFEYFVALQSFSDQRFSSLISTKPFRHINNKRIIDDLI